METPTYTLEIIDDGTLDTVVLCSVKGSSSSWTSELERCFRYPSRTFRYCSDYRFSFENDAAFLDAIREEVEDEVEELIIAEGMG